MNAHPKIRFAILCCGALFAAACETPNGATNPASAAPSPSCAVSGEDQAWIDRSVAAWRDMSERTLPGGAPARMTSVFFDKACMLTSTNAMADGGNDAEWNAAAHAGMVPLPDGDVMPAVVTSFTKADGDDAYFVMSTPSVWRAGGVDGGPLGLERLMTAVLLHEGVHVAQFPTYGAEITALVERNNLPDSFNDDSIQKEFESDPAFAASVEKEMTLLFAAAAAMTDDDARRLAQQARALMAARRARWFTGEKDYLNDAEDLFLTLEGAGQWTGYVWLISPQGGGASQDDAMAGFAKRSKWWSQKLGLAMFLAIDRLGYDWRPQAFGAADLTAMQLLDAALAPKAD